MIKTCMLTGVEYEVGEPEQEPSIAPASRYIDRIVPADELSIFADRAYKIFNNSAALRGSEPTKRRC